MMLNAATVRYLVCAVLAIVSCPCSCRAGERLSDRYPATRSWSQHGLATNSTADDVWRISSFEIVHEGALALRCGPSTVVFGRNGTDVLWAVVMPNEPASIRGERAPEKEHAQSILLRFAPSEVARVFPAETIAGPGDGWRRHEAQRIASRKMVWRWCTPAGHSTIVPAAVLLIDVETVEGPRRFWAIDRNEQKVLRVEDFTDQPVPPLRPIEQDAALAAFNHVWSAFDREYAKFIDLPNVDWPALGERYREHIKRADSTFMLGAILSEMLAHLEDLHVSVRVGDDWLAGYTRDRPVNGNWQATLAQLVEHESLGADLVIGQTAGGFGYLGVHNLADPNLPGHIDAALEQLRDTNGIIVDLRFNGGGDEMLGRAIAGRFVAEPVTYSKNQYRSGLKHSDLGPVLDRVLEPRGPWRYDRPVVCLFGRHTLSSAESLAAMFDMLPQVMTMGSPTGGSSGNPRAIELDCGIIVILPRWRDLLADGTPLEGRGLSPDVMVEYRPEQFTDAHDPVFDTAVKSLREWIDAKPTDAAK